MWKQVDGILKPKNDTFLHFSIKHSIIMVWFSVSCFISKVLSPFVFPALSLPVFPTLFRCFLVFTCVSLSALPSIVLTCVRPDLLYSLCHPLSVFGCCHHHGCSCLAVLRFVMGASSCLPYLLLSCFVCVSRPVSLFSFLFIFLFVV